MSQKPIILSFFLLLAGNSLLADLDARGSEVFIGAEKNLTNNTTNLALSSDGRSLAVIKSEKSGKLLFTTRLYSLNIPENRVDISDNLYTLKIVPGKFPPHFYVFSVPGLTGWLASGLGRFWLLDQRGRLTGQFKTKCGDSLRIAIHPQGREFACTRDKFILRYDFSGKFIGGLAGHGREIYSAAYDPTGERLLVNYRDQTHYYSTLWNLNARPAPKNIWNLKLYLQWSNKRPTMMAPGATVFHPSGAFYYQSAYRYVQLRRSRNGELFAQLKSPSPSAGLAVSADGNLLASTNDEGGSPAPKNAIVYSYVWRLGHNNLIKIADIPSLIYHYQQVFFFPDENFLVLHKVYSPRVRFYNITGGRTLDFIFIDGGGWFASSSDGFYDVSEGAAEQVYFVQKNEISRAEKLKRRLRKRGLIRDFLRQGAKP